MCNPLGAVHGGALGSIAIGAAEWAAQSGTLSSINLQFCAAAKSTRGLLFSERQCEPIKTRNHRAPPFRRLKAICCFPQLADVIAWTTVCARNPPQMLSNLAIFVAGSLEIAAPRSSCAR
eukprot:scaffold7033_cov257-Pinguiococcus_pyrenoidosus.AAC.33